MIDIKTPLNNNNDGNSENDKIIFKYVAKNIENVSNFGENSYVQTKVKNVEESANSSEIFVQESDRNRYSNISKEDQKDDNKEEKKRKRN